MKNMLGKGKFLNAAAILLVIGFIIRLGADYFKYQNGFSSAPFDIYIIVRSIEFLLPSIICFIIAGYVKKSSSSK